jgi:membrane protein YdbS with pleckstrin-like domain
MAEYVETLLAPGETITTNARQHWWALIRFALTPILILGLGILGLLIGFWIGGEGFFAGIVDTLVGLATVIAFIVAAVWLPIQLVRWNTRRYVLTTRRVISFEGLMRKTSIDASLDKITDVGYRQTWLGARLGFGDLGIATAAGNPIELREIREANEFKKAIMVQQEALIRERAGTILAGAQAVAPAVTDALGGTAQALASAPPPPPPPPPAEAAPMTPAAPAAGGQVSPASTPDEITSTLAQLADLRDQGMITAEDYEAKKQELLGRL